jgi:hypothetical protein
MVVRFTTTICICAISQCLSSLKLRVGISFITSVVDTILCDKVCLWLATGQWFSPGSRVFSTNKTDCHDITEILLKVAFGTLTLRPKKNNNCLSTNPTNPNFKYLHKSLNLFPFLDKHC